MSLQVRGLTRFREAGPSTPLKNASLRACDFFVFSQKWVLKTNGLCAKKSRKFKKVTNSQDDRFILNVGGPTQGPSLSALTSAVLRSLTTVLTPIQRRSCFCAGFSTA